MAQENDGVLLGISRTKEGRRIACIFRVVSGAIMVGDRKREIWPCPYDMGQNFYF